MQYRELSLGFLCACLPIDVGGRCLVYQCLTVGELRETNRRAASLESEKTIHTLQAIRIHPDFDLGDSSRRWTHLLLM